MGNNLMSKLGLDEASEDVRKARAAARLYGELIDELVKCRERAGLTQTEVARGMRTSQSSVSELESANSDARFSTLLRYVHALGCEIVIEITDSPGKSNHGTFHENAASASKTDWVKVKMGPGASVHALKTSSRKLGLNSRRAFGYSVRGVSA